MGPEITIVGSFAVGLTMVLLGPWMLDTMLAFTIEVYKQIPAMTAS